MASWVNILAAHSCSTTTTSGYTTLHHPVHGLMRHSVFRTADYEAWRFTPVTLQLTVLEQVEAHFFVPNAFTPNHDNLNDVFLPVCEGIEVERFLMLIYDRQGRCLFKSTNLHFGWDGKDMNGTVCPMGVYTYYIRYWTHFDHPQGPGHPQLTGSVTLIR